MTVNLGGAPGPRIGWADADGRTRGARSACPSRRSRCRARRHRRRPSRPRRRAAREGGAGAARADAGRQRHATRRRCPSRRVTATRASRPARAGQGFGLATGGNGAKGIELEVHELLLPGLPRAGRCGDRARRGIGRRASIGVTIDAIPHPAHRHHRQHQHRAIERQSRARRRGGARALARAAQHAAASRGVSRQQPRLAHEIRESAYLANTRKHR